MTNTVVIPFTSADTDPFFNRHGGRNAWHQAERRRLAAASERIARRRAWWIAQRDAASIRLAELDREMAAADVAIAELDAAETQVAIGRERDVQGGAG